VSATYTFDEWKTVRSKNGSCVKTKDGESIYRISILINHIPKSSKMWFALKLVDLKSPGHEVKWDNNNGWNFEVRPDKLRQICVPVPPPNFQNAEIARAGQPAPMKAAAQVAPQPRPAHLSPQLVPPLGGMQMMPPLFLSSPAIQQQILQQQQPPQLLYTPSPPAFPSQSTQYNRPNGLPNGPNTYPNSNNYNNNNNNYINTNPPGNSNYNNNNSNYINANPPGNNNNSNSNNNLLSYEFSYTNGVNGYYYDSDDDFDDFFPSSQPNTPSSYSTPNGTGYYTNTNNNNNSNNSNNTTNNNTYYGNQRTCNTNNTGCIAALLPSCSDSRNTSPHHQPQKFTLESFIVNTQPKRCKNKVASNKSEKKESKYDVKMLVGRGAESNFHYYSVTSAV